MTDEPVLQPDSDGDEDAADAEWPLSNYPLLLAILFLVGATVALVISTEAAANRLATYAYYALVVGVALRLVEGAGGDRLRRASSGASDAARSAVRAARDAFRSVRGRE